MVKTYSLKKDGEKNLSKHFKVKEFGSFSGSRVYSDTVKISTKLIKVLEKIFEKDNLGVEKINITSGYRTLNHDTAVAGHSTSRPHTTGKAVDFICYDKNNKVISAKKICCVLEDFGNIFGIGYISSNAVHMDVDFRTKAKKWWGDETTKGQRTIQFFGYNSWYTYFKNPYKEPKANVLKGDKGESVWWVQYELKSKGYLNCAISGTFGKKTEKAIIKFKKKHNLGGKNPSSVVGEKTIKALKLRR